MQSIDNRGGVRVISRAGALLVVLAMLAGCSTSEENPGSPPPTVDITAAVTSVVSGTSTMLSWTSTDATSCAAAGSWSGSKPTSGSESTGVLTADATFTLTCSGEGPAATDSVVVAVTLPSPTVTLAANPTSVASGGSTQLTWSSTNATSCLATGGWTGTKATSGSQSTGALNATTQFTLACTGTGGTAQQSVTVTVNATTPPPTVSISANPTTINAGGQSVLTWNSSNATSCTASGAWTGSKALNGNETVGPLQTTSTFTLSCNGAGGNASQSATVTVNGGSVSLQGQVDSSYLDIFGDNRVYVFSGNVVPDDIDGDAVEPVLTLPVGQDANACTFRYAGGSLAAGTYTIAFTQDAAADVPGQSNTLVFVGTRTVTIGTSSVTADFRPSTILQVGPGRQFATLRAANAAATNGSVIEIDAGTYNDDVTVWRQNNVVIRGIGGRAHIRGTRVIPFVSGDDYNNGMGLMVTRGDGIRVENIEFSLARVVDENGAGIRVQSSGLTVCNCYFHDNEDGMLGGGGTLVVEYSEFNNNGLTDFGFNHNIYVDDGERFIFRHNYSHHVQIGHLVKTRARENHILYNRLMDEVTGSSSYNIDVPDGGLTFIIGNVMQQGPGTDNSMMVSYASESLGGGRTHELYLVNNTFVNDAGFGGFVQFSGGTALLRNINNLFVGNGSQPSGGNVQSTTNLLTNAPGLLDEAGFDYHLTATSPARNTGTAPGTARGVDLTPVYQYKHRANRDARTTEGSIDIGAHEFTP